jgi:hypothetical protein
MIEVARGIFQAGNTFDKIGSQLPDQIDRIRHARRTPPGIAYGRRGSNMS